MSIDLRTMEKGITIHSFSDGDTYWISAFNVNNERIRENQWKHKAYGALLREFWQAYFTHGKKPELLGYVLPESSLLNETSHFLCPVNLGDSPLKPYRASLLHWLLSEQERLKTTLHPKHIKDFSEMLEYIVTQDSKAKSTVPS